MDIQLYHVLLSVHRLQKDKRNLKRHSSIREANTRDGGVLGVVVVWAHVARVPNICTTSYAALQRRHQIPSLTNDGGM